MNNYIDKYRHDYFCLVIGLLIFSVSLYVSRIYIGGDQFGYHSAYGLIEGLGWREGFRLYENRVSGAEPLHFAFVLLSSNLGIDKNLIMSFLNAVVGVSAVRLFKIWGVDYRIASVVVLTNFYMLVLYFAAERLKFGFLFLLLAFINIDRPIAFLLLMIASMLSHFSMIAIYSGLWLYCIYSLIGNRTLSRLEIAGGLLVVAGALIYLWHEREYLHWKLATYRELNTAAGIQVFPVLGMLLLSIYYARSVVQPAILFLPVVIGVSLIGGSRLNMMAFAIFMYFGMRVNNGVNVGVITGSAYFAYKSIDFLSNVIDHGHGFQ